MLGVTFPSPALNSTNTVLVPITITAAFPLGLHTVVPVVPLPLSVGP